MLLDLDWVRLWDGVWHGAADWVWDWVWYTDRHAAGHVNGVWAVDGDWDWVWHADWDGSGHGHRDGVRNGHWHMTGDGHGVRLWHGHRHNLVGLAHFDWYSLGSVAGTVAGTVSGRQTVAGRQTGRQTVSGRQTGRQTGVGGHSVSVAQTVRQIGASLVVGLGFSSLGRVLGCAEPDQCQTDDACLKNEKTVRRLTLKRWLISVVQERLYYGHIMCAMILYRNTVDFGSELACNLPIYHKTDGNNDDYNLLIRYKVKRVSGFLGLYSLAVSII